MSVSVILSDSATPQLVEAKMTGVSDLLRGTGDIYRPESISTDEYGNKVRHETTVVVGVPCALQPSRGKEIIDGREFENVDTWLYVEFSDTFYPQAGDYMQNFEVRGESDGNTYYFETVQNMAGRARLLRIGCCRSTAND